MSAGEPDGFPWTWLYYRALEIGMAADVFWRSSPRAVHLLYRVARQQQRVPAPGRVREKPAPGRVREKPADRRVRLNYLPHP